MELIELLFIFIKRILTVIFLLPTAYCLLPTGSFAQQDKNKEPINLKTDLTPSITFETEEEPEEEVKKKKKKKKKKVFYGLKCKKGFIKKGAGKRETIEIFHYLKKYIEPDSYVWDIYWYDTKRGKIIKSRKAKFIRVIEKDPNAAKVLHGPYKKMIGDKLVEEGIYYIGTKHGRWAKYNKDFVLVEKKKYYRGWPKDADITYYDAECTKIKEVIPYEYEVLRGKYFLFFENAMIAIEGIYKDGIKVGKWTEYYESDRKRRKIITQYVKLERGKIPKDSEDFIPFVLKEWNIKGKVIYDKEKVDRMKKGR